MRVARDGSSFSWGTDVVDLSRNKLLARLLRALAQERLSSPGSSLTVNALMEIGWPGEKMRRDAGQNRVYVAIAALRRAGLAGELERDEVRYRLRPVLRVELYESAPVRE